MNRGKMEETKQNMKQIHCVAMLNLISEFPIKQALLPDHWNNNDIDLSCKINSFEFTSKWLYPETH